MEPRVLKTKTLTGLRHYRKFAADTSQLPLVERTDERSGLPSGDNAVRGATTVRICSLQQNTIS